MGCIVFLQPPACGGWEQALIEESPTLSARRLGAELGRLRVDKKLTLNEVADRLGWSPTKLQRIERQGRGLKTADLAFLLSLYEITSEDELEHLQALNRASNKRGWWREYEDVFSSALFFPILGGANGPQVVFVGSSRASLENELSYSFAVLSGVRDQWNDLANRGVPTISSNGEPVRIKVADCHLTLSSDYASWLVNCVVAFLTRILSIIQSGLAKLALARVVLAAEALIQGFLIAASMSHRHRREPSDDTSPLMANYRPSAGVAAAL